VIAGIDFAELKIAGRWLHQSYRERIDSLIKQLGMSSRVEIVGEVSEGRLNSLYANARAAVIVNEERGFGLTALEAASNGCTFIIPEGCGASEFFEKDRDGFFFKSGDSAMLGDHIRTVLGNEDRAYSMGEHAWRTVSDKYAWPKHAESVIAGVNTEDGWDQS
jgi:glycosyltransferase involved in cell wall biosynthesis